MVTVVVKQGIVVVVKHMAIIVVVKHMVMVVVKPTNQRGGEEKSA
jgi:hypothetical protein